MVDMVAEVGSELLDASDRGAARRLPPANDESPVSLFTKLFGGRARATAGDRRAARRWFGMMGSTRLGSEGADLVTDEELVVEFALTRLDNAGLDLEELDLEEIAAMVVRRVGPDAMLQFASQNLAVRGELRGGAFETAVEYVLRTVLKLRDDVGD
jgi:hypothetical protein